MAALLAAKVRLRDATRTYIESLSEEQLNTTLAKRPEGWFGELRSPAFILLHVITHTFHHKGQAVAMLRAVGHPAPDTDLQRARASGVALRAHFFVGAEAPPPKHLCHQ